MIGVLQAAFLLCLALLEVRLGLGVLYDLGLAAAAAVMGWQHRLIRDRDLDACFAAFRSNHYVGMAVFAGLFADLTLAG